MAMRIEESVRVVVASLNPVKREAVCAAFRGSFPGVTLDVCALACPSGVSEQPLSDEETRRGARNRALAAQAARPDATFWVGLEGGLDRLDGRLVAFAWMAVAGPGDRVSEARSVTLPVPPAVQALIEKGLELGEANDRVFSTRNSKQGGGAFGLLTHGRYTREQVYAETLTMALIPFVSDLWD